MTHRALASVLTGATLGLAPLACSDRAGTDLPVVASGASSTSLASTSDASAQDAPADAGALEDASASPVAAALPGRTEGCPEGMVLVEGDDCPDGRQTCQEHHEEFTKDEARKRKKREAGQETGNSTVSERCLRYEAPSVCRSKERR